MNKSDYDIYHKKGGSYIIPVEVFNELFDEIEELQQRIDKGIKFIEYNMEYYYEDDIDNLLDILKGNDNSKEED